MEATYFMKKQKARNT